MAAFDNLDPITLQNILATMPEIRRRKSKADQIRAAKDQFSKLAETEGTGNYAPRQRGGLFETVQQYQPDYAAMGNKITGALGGFMADREQRKADESLSSMQDEQILRTANQIGQDVEGGATDNAMRAYLGMIGGPDVTKIMGKEPHVSGRHVDKDGFIWSQDSKGEWTNSGIQVSPKTQILQIPGQVPQIADLSGSNTGSARDVQFGGGVATPPFNPNAVPGQAPQGAAPAGDPAEEAERWYQAVEAQESTGDPNAVSPKGAQGLMQLMPATAREMENALGMEPGATARDPAANRAAGRAYLDQRMKARNGDRNLALMDYNWGQGNVDRWMATGGDPAQVPKETRDYVQQVTRRATGGQPAQAPSAASVPSPSSFRLPTKAEEAGAAETAKINAQLAQAPATAAAKGLDAEEQALGKTRAEMAQRLPGARQSVAQLKNATTSLRNNKDLDRILGGSSMGALSTFDEKGNLVRSAKAIQSYFDPKGANVLAEYENVAGKVYKEAFETLKGGGPITEKETEAVSNAYARLQRTQDPRAFRAALDDMISNAEAGLAKLEAFGSGRSAGSVPAAAPAAAGGWKVRVKP